MNSVRFLCEVEGVAPPAAAQPCWRLTVRQVGSAWVAAPRELRKAQAADGSSFPLPPTTDLPAAGEIHAALCDDVARAQEVFERLSQRALQDKDVESFGRYLFQTLLGPALWNEIKLQVPAGSSIELALCWNRDERDLHRLNWELMHAPDGFLARGFDRGGKPVRVALTRVVADAVGPTRALSLPPRLLCVVGCALNDPRIRAGAELLGLLRQLDKEQRQRSLHTKVLLQATVDELETAVREFRPDIVHFICHGSTRDDGAGCLEFVRKPGDVAPGPHLVDAHQLGVALKVDTTGGQTFTPAIVVLSACYSGTIEGPVQTAPLAAQLVSENLPVVVGMAGSVADRVCRLFTRFFGEALVMGTPLVAAVERGRRAAFTQGEAPTRTADWSYPTLYLSRDVVPDQPLTPAADTDAERELRTALGALGLLPKRNEPVFATRFELLDACYREWVSGQKPVLVLVGEEDSGKTRLLRELAAQALRDGHLPVILARDQARNAGFTAEELRLDLVRALDLACQAFQVPPRLGRQLVKLKPPLNPDAPPDKLNPFVAAALESDRCLSARILGLALRQDLTDLLADVQARPSPGLRPDARPLLLVDEVQTLPAEFLQDLFSDDARKVLGDFGLGDRSDRPIPVVLTFNWAGPAYDVLRPVAEGKHPDWIRKVDLSCFPQENGEDLQIYSRVLLYPHNPKLYDQVSDRAWVFNWQADPQVREKWIKRIRKRMKKLPADFIEDELYKTIEDASDDDFVRLADDNDALKELA